MFSAICEHLRIDETNKRVFLFDRFRDSAVDRDTGETLDGDLRYANHYASSIEKTQRNFQEWRTVELIEGDLPGSLAALGGRMLSLLHVDLNAAKPEVESVRELWPQLSNGALILLDDYGFPGHIAQFRALNDLSREIGFSIAALPTGQGLILK